MIDTTIKTYTLLSEYNKKYYAENVDKRREYSRKYRAENVDKIRESRKKYYAENADKRAENADKRREYNKKWYAENADKERERSRKYKAENVDKIRESRKKYYAENIDKFRDRNLQNRYGIGHEEYLELFEKQDGKCKICETTSNRKWKHFAVDHCHDTGDVRGLLCSNCNTAIGLLKDNPDLLRTAAKYIEEAYND